MNPLAYVNVLLQVAAAAPSLENDIKGVLAANWSHGLVADAKQGVAFLAKLIADVESAMTPPAVTEVTNLSA